MRTASLRHLLLSLLAVPSLVTVVHTQQAPLCREWQECRQLALDADLRGEYERFHDLAWRAVQTGAKNDPDLMYLLARAQVLSGRPHDALVMLQRLAERGVATDAAINPDFRRTRDLPGWPEVAAAIARAAAATPPPAVEPVRERSMAAAAPGAPAPVVSPREAGAPRTPPADAASSAPAPISPPASPSPEPVRAAPPGRTLPSAPAATAAPAASVAPVAVAPFPVELASTSEAVQFSTKHFRTAGLAYDAVSLRFLIGDALGRKLIVVGVGSEHADDLVRADSAGFGDVVALDIDYTRGDLWVASTPDAKGESALHRLQLVSGRPLKTYRAAASLGPTRLIDLAVQASGAVVALDAAGNRLLALAPGSSDITVAMALKLSGARSVAAASDGLLYVAHDDGIARIDLRAGTATAVSAPRHFDLLRFDAIRASRNSLIALQTTPAGSQQLVRLNLNPTGRLVREGTVIDSRVAGTTGRVSLTVKGDDVYYLATDAPGAAASPSATGAAGIERFVIRRLTLR